MPVNDPESPAAIELGSAVTLTAHGLRYEVTSEMTATEPATDWIAATTGPVTALMRPCTACWASATAAFQMPTKKPPTVAPTPLPDGALNVSALNTVSITLWMNPDTSVHGAVVTFA